jgi:hypothetical protein
MGLLERALEYKRKINKEGKETLIDRLNKQSETDIRSQPTAEKVHADEIDEVVLKNSESDNHKNEKISEENENTESSKEDIVIESAIGNSDVDKSLAENPKVVSKDIVNINANDFNNEHNDEEKIISPDSNINISETDNVLSEITEVEKYLDHDELVEIHDIESDIKNDIKEETKES